MKKLIEIGDRVKITHYGNIYNSFDDQARAMGATKWHESTSAHIFKDKIGIVKNKMKHIHGDTITICLVDIGQREILIAEEGLTNIEPVVFGIVKFLKGFEK